MTQTVTLPLWLYLILLAAAALAALEWLLLPSVRWYFRRKMKRVIQEINVRLERCGAHVYIPRADRDYAITVGVRMLTLRRLISERDGLYGASRDQVAVLNYYANSIAYLVERTGSVPQAHVASA